MTTRRAIGGLAALVLLATTVWIAAPYATTTAFLLDISGSTSWARRLLPARVRHFTTRDLQVPTRYGAIPARLYQPDVRSDRSVIVFPGVHAGGVDEPRLAALAGRLAGTGATVLSVPLPELRRYRLTPASTDMIEDAASWMASDPALAPRRRVSLAGVSFAGGLAIVAAGRPSLSDKVQAVVAIGGHADLPRTATYLCTGRLPDGRLRAPHDYGAVVFLLEATPRLVPPSQIELTTHAITMFLDGASLTSSDPERAARVFAEARQAAATAPEPARTLLALVTERNVSALGARLLPYVEALTGAAALSPDRSPATRAPVFLLHGAEDNIIPSSETLQLADYLHQQGNAHVHWLLTPLVTHATMIKGTTPDTWRLLKFWTQVLEAQ